MSSSPVEPWLSIIGIGEDGLTGLPLASRKALDAAEVVFGGPRHLALADVGQRGCLWPVPFDVDAVLAQRGKRVAILATGDPFWFGAGGSVARHLDAAEWSTYPAPSTFSHAAARLGWRLEDTICLGLHAAPFERLGPIMSRGVHILCLVRDAAAVASLCQWLTCHGWGETAVTALSALGGPNEHVEQSAAMDGKFANCAAPVTVALEAKGGHGLPRASGLSDHLFLHDGQITKRPIRALALSALAPRAGEMLWDVGAGSGSISIEWALAGGYATAIEQKQSRAANIRRNAERFGVAHRVSVVEGSAPGVLPGLVLPDAVFVGGGLTRANFDALWDTLPQLSRGQGTRPHGTRLVVHGVTLETQSLLSDLHAHVGGDLDRFEFSRAEPLGRMRAWQASRPIVQWTARK